MGLSSTGGKLSLPVEVVAFNVGPHNFHAARVDQEPCSSLHTSLNHVLCAWERWQGGEECTEAKTSSLAASFPPPIFPIILDEGPWLPSPGPRKTTAGQ